VYRGYNHAALPRQIARHISLSNDNLLRLPLPRFPLSLDRQGNRQVRETAYIAVANFVVRPHKCQHFSSLRFEHDIRPKTDQAPANDNDRRAAIESHPANPFDFRTCNLTGGMV